MRIIACVVLILFSCSTTRKTDTGTIESRPLKPVMFSDTFVFKSNSEIGVISYQIQRSPTKSRWTTVVDVTPKLRKDSNWYIIPLPPVNVTYYYRLIANLEVSLSKTKKKKVTYTQDPVFIQISK